jgi:hypothetical protein
VRAERKKPTIEIVIPKAESPKEPVVLALPLPSGGELYRTTSPLNLRWKPDITAKIRTVLDIDTPVTVYDIIANTWAYVRIPDGRDGFVGVAKLRSK